MYSYFGEGATVTLVHSYFGEGAMVVLMYTLTLVRDSWNRIILSAELG